MPDNTSTTAVTEGVTSAQEIPSSNTSADDKTPTEPSTTPELDKTGSPDVSTGSVGEVVLTPLKSPKEKVDSPPNKKTTNTPKKAPGKLANTKKGPRGRSGIEVNRGKSVDGGNKPATPKKAIPQAILSRQSTVSSTMSTPGTPKKAVRLDISLDGTNKLGTPKKTKKMNRFRSKSPKKSTAKPSKVQKAGPLRSSTPKRKNTSNNSAPTKAAHSAPQKQESNELNGAESIMSHENGGLEMTNSPKKEKAAAPKPQRKIFVASTKPPKIVPRSQSPNKARKGKPSAWR